MVHLILKQIWNWLSEGWSNMADLADRIDDLICSFEGGTDTTMDTVAMLIFGWLLFGLFVLGVAKYIYTRFVVKTETKEKPVIVEPVVKPVVSASVIEDAAVTTPIPVKEVIKSAPRSSSGGSGVGVVAPTPPVRRRFSAKKSSPSPARTVSYIPPPQATGPEKESVRWVNDMFQWLYSDLVVVNEVLNLWIQSLNDFSQKSVAEHGVGVEFVRVLPETHAPQLSNVFCECDSKDDVTITCDCEAMPALQVKAFRQKGDKVDISHYRVNVNRLRARLSIVCITEKLLADVKCDGWPEIKIALASVGTIKSNSLDEQQLQDLVSEIVVVALRNTMIHLNFSQYPNCPRLSRYPVNTGFNLPLHYDSMHGYVQSELKEFHRRQDILGTELPSQYKSIPGRTIIERRLLVKVIKANNLGGKKGCREPYCVVEMDDPAQKNQTSIKKDTNSPTWDEHFLFDVTPTTAEVLFEIYDREDKQRHRFLGHGIVGVEELLINPSQRQVISLQSRPFEEDEVSGTLTVEFLFIEGADIPQLGDKPYKLKETLRTVSPKGGVVTTTKTIFAKSDQENLTNGGDVVTDSALKELELKNRGGGGTVPASKSTLIIHSVQRQPQQRQLVKQNADQSNQQQAQDGADGTVPASGTLDDRSRSRRKKRDIFGTIKRRLGRSKTRSKSMDPGERDEMMNNDTSLSRSISADRARDPSAHSAVPGLRGVDGDSTRSSLSEMSGMSGASTRTYVNEASTLVLETIENGITKHYLVPLSMAQKSKWKKKGTKLHIFNDHTFIAKHLSGNVTCQVCTKSIARRLGKQGYECRDCQLKCHKHCHIKVDTTCPSSTIHSIELSLLPVLSE